MNYDSVTQMTTTNDEAKLDIQYNYDGSSRMDPHSILLKGHSSQNRATHIQSQVTDDHPDSNKLIIQK